MKMRILYAGQKFNNIITGGQRRIAMVLEYLSKINGKVVCLQKEDSPTDFVKRHFLLTNLWYILQGARINKTEDIVILEDYSQRFHLFFFNFFILPFRKVKLVCFANAFYFNCRESILKNSIDKVISILFLKTADLLIAGGEAAKKMLIEMGIDRKKIVTVYPALRPEFVKARQKEWIATNNSFVKLLFVGRMNPIKGLEYLLEAIKLLKAQNLTLTIVGDISSVPRYTQTIKDRIREFGIEDRVKLEDEIKDVNQLLEIYSTSDVFVLPSLWDTSPITIIEAMCVGLPIVATNVGGIPEWVENGVNGILVPPRNSQTLADAIMRLIQDIHLMKEMGRKGYEMSFRFKGKTWEDVGKECHKVISELIGA
jgi:glycosyltransferase involved in cell wall biosynthesis